MEQMFSANITSLHIEETSFHQWTLAATPEEKSSVQGAKIYLSVFEEVTPQQVANHIVGQLPNVSKLEFFGRLGSDSGKRLIPLLAALISSSRDEPPPPPPLSPGGSNTINFLDFSEVFTIDAPIEADLKLLDVILQSKQNSIKGLVFPSGFFPTEESLKGCYYDRLGKIIQNNNESLELMYLPAAPAPFGGVGRPGDAAPSSLVEAIRNNNTLTYLDLEFRVGDDMMEALIDLLKNKKKCTLQYFYSYDLYDHKHWEIISYYLAMNNLGRKDWGKNLASSSEFINTLSSKIPKPEKFDTYGKTDDKSSPSWYFTHCNSVSFSEEEEGKEKKLFYASIVYDYLHYNLDLFSSLQR